MPSIISPMSSMSSPKRSGAGGVRSTLNGAQLVPSIFLIRWIAKCPRRECALGFDEASHQSVSPLIPWFDPRDDSCDGREREEGARRCNAIANER